MRRSPMSPCRAAVVATLLAAVAVAAVPTAIAAAATPARAAAPAPAAASADPDTTAIALTRVSVIDLARGALLANRAVVVAGGRVRAVTPMRGFQPPPGARVVDGHGGVLLPGLWDMHVHALWDTTVARRFLAGLVANGVTGVRDMGGTLDVLHWARAGVANGTLVAPRIVAAGVILDGPEPVSPEISWPVADAATARRDVDSLAEAGADFIKLYTLLPRDAALAAIAEAHARGLAAAGHVPAALGIGEAALAGMRSMEHLRDEIAPLCDGLDANACGRLLDTLRAAHVWQTPTLVVNGGKRLMQDSTMMRDPRFALLPAAVRDDWLAQWRQRTLRPASYFEEKRARFIREQTLVRELARHHVSLLAGTDCGLPFAYPGSGLHDELEALVTAGLSPLEALRAATLEPAAYLGAQDSLGGVFPGATADLVLLAADPLAKIHNSRSVLGVMLRGQWLDHAALQHLQALADGVTPR